MKEIIASIKNNEETTISHSEKPVIKLVTSNTQDDVELINGRCAPASPCNPSLCRPATGPCGPVSPCGPTR